MMVVDVNLGIPPTYRPQYAILRDKTRKEVRDFARKHPRCFVFPFITVAPEDCFDYRGLHRKGDPESMYIVKPFYVGNLEPMEDMIRQYVSFAFNCDLSECEEVL